MKKWLTVFLVISSTACYSQQVINLRIGSAARVSDTSKQDKLSSGVNIKTVNGQTLLAGGDLTVTAAPTPDANFYANPGGNDGLNGTTQATAKRTLRSLDTAINASSLTSVKAALEGGSIYRGTDGIVVKRGAVTITSYNRDKAGKFHFPIMLGTDVFNTGWTLTGSNTYQQNIPNSVTIATGHYAYVYVIEVDTTLEKVDFFAARKYLRYVPSVAAVDTTIGSFYCPYQEPSASPILISMRSSDGVSPNNHPRFRYEVVTRDRAVNRDQNQLGFGNTLTVENLIALDYAQGTGPFASRQDSFIMKRCVVGGTTVHQLVCGNFSAVKKCVFLGGDSYIPEQVAIVFYQNQGGGPTETDVIENSYFIDVARILYSHTGDGSGDAGYLRHGRINFHNNYVFNALDGLKAAYSVDTTDMNFSYWKDCDNAIILNESKITYIRNSVMENGVSLIYHATNAFVENTLFRSRHVPSSAVVMSTNHKLDVQHSIFHIKTDTLYGTEGGNVFNNGDTSTSLNAKYNIFVMDIKAGGSGVWTTSNNYAGVGQSKQKFDYNVYIKVGQGVGLWKLNDASVNGGDPSVRTLSAWQTLTGQDQHSIFIDLNVYENDLKRIFIDPDAGNYNLANTPQADSIRAIIDSRGNTASPAGMRTPLTTFISKPSRAQAVDFVENDAILPVSALFSINTAGYTYKTLQRVTTTQRNSIYPSVGRHVFDTTTNKEYTGDGTSWNALW